jgi:hypothetical protein
MRMSVAAFARHLGVSARAVANWNSRGPGIKLRWDMQRNLDRVYETLSTIERQRFRELLTAPAAGLAALTSALISPPGPARKGGLFQLERAVGKARIAYQAGRSRDAVAMLPGLIGAAAQPVSPRAHKVAADVYHVASGLLLRLGDVPMATLAATKCRQEAESSDSPLSIAASARASARTLMRSGHPHAAAELSARAAGELRGLKEPRPVSAQGALLLRGAVAAAQAQETDWANGLLDQASACAAALGGDGNFGWTAFGPSNVEIHRAGVLNTLGDPAGALEVLRRLNPGQIPQAERKARYYIEIARAWEAQGDPGRALSARRQAAQAAPGLLNG